MLFHTVQQICGSFSGSIRIRHIQLILFNLCPVKGLDGYGSDRTGIGSQGNAKCGKQFRCDSSGRHTANGFSTGGTSTSPVVTETVFFIKSVVGMSWTVIGSNFRIITGTLGSVSYQHGNWCSGGFASKTPDRISTVSSSFRGVANLLCPGFLRFKKNLNIFLT